MRNSKAKGFTLIELIVVIAIIAVLAAILVPSMLGYVRNSRISRANANAKQVNTAFAAALTQISIGGKTIAANKEVDLTCKLSSADLIKVTGCSGTAKDADFDLISYLGSNFTGVGYAKCVAETYSVKYAGWSENPSAANADFEQVSEATQKKNAKTTGKIVGIYPLLAS